MASFLSLLLLLLLSFSTFATAGTKCYGLNGTELDSTFGPCKPAARHSGCCAIHRPAGSADICLDNGLCMATHAEYMGTIFQAGCTDPTGKDPGCPRMCPDVNTDFNGLNPVLAWNVQMCDYGKYCCRADDDRNNCCNNATAPKIQTTFLGAFQFQTSRADLATATASTTSSTSLPSTTQILSSILANAISTGSPFEQNSTPSPTTTPPEICHKDKSAIVGGTVGGTLGAALLCLLGLILWMHRKEKRQRKLKEHYEAQFEQSWAYRRTIVESDAREVGTPEEKNMDVREDYKFNGAGEDGGS